MVPGKEAKVIFLYQTKLHSAFQRVGQFKAYFCTHVETVVILLAVVSPQIKPDSGFEVGVTPSGQLVLVGYTDCECLIIPKIKLLCNKMHLRELRSFGFYFNTKSAEISSLSGPCIEHPFSIAVLM